MVCSVIVQRPPQPPGSVLSHKHCRTDTNPQPRPAYRGPWRPQWVPRGTQTRPLLCGAEKGTRLVSADPPREPLPLSSRPGPGLPGRVSAFESRSPRQWPSSCVSTVALACECPGERGMGPSVFWVPLGVPGGPGGGQAASRLHGEGGREAGSLRPHHLATTWAPPPSFQARLLPTALSGCLHPQAPGPVHCGP